MYITLWFLNLLLTNHKHINYSDCLKMLIFELVLNMTVLLSGPLSSDLTNVSVSALKYILYSLKLKKKKNKLILYYTIFNLRIITIGWMKT